MIFLTANVVFNVLLFSACVGASIMFLELINKELVKRE